MRKAGPTPQMSPPHPGALGDRKRLCRVSPSPVSLLSPMTSLWWMIGRMVREIRFQCSVRPMGITGCTFSV
jgi:hypothetical protein